MWKRSPIQGVEPVSPSGATTEGFWVEKKLERRPLKREGAGRAHAAAARERVAAFGVAGRVEHSADGAVLIRREVELVKVIRRSEDVLDSESARDVRRALLIVVLKMKRRRRRMRRGQHLGRRKTGRKEGRGQRSLRVQYGARGTHPLPRLLLW